MSTDNLEVRIDLDRVVVDVLERVLMIDRSRIVAEAELVRDLGAESIDILDMLFGLEDALEVPVTPEDWSDWVSRRLPDARRGEGITVALVREFAREHLNHRLNPTLRTEE